MPAESGNLIRIEVVTGLDPVLVRLVGEIDLLAVPRLRSALLPLSSQSVEIDCTGVTFLDSSGVNLLLGQVRRSHQAGGQLRIIHLPPCVLRVLEIVGALEYLAGSPHGEGPPRPGRVGTR